jgi:site-specific DNA-methyltransferase (adenine-specific)
MAERVPDIMEVIADLSNDEVRTPPKVANAVLDLLPATVWANSEYRWLDPGSKSGVFLREITKRLMVGLEKAIPDEKDRLAHILRNQVHGIGITALSAMMSRRALYCSKNAAGPESVAQMASPEGLVWHERVSHLFKAGRCSECGAGQDQFGHLRGENYAYAFIHQNGRDAISKEWDLKFDIIVGNPPYQMRSAGKGTNSPPIYDQFVDVAIGLDPEHIVMIIPSRWMSGGMGLAGFRKRMLEGGHLAKIVDFSKQSDVFPNPVDFEGGVQYFRWSRDHKGLCEVTLSSEGQVTSESKRDLNAHDVFVRDPRAVPILEKAMGAEDESLAGIVSEVSPFGFATNFKGFSESPGRSESFVLNLYLDGKRTQRWVRPELVLKSMDLATSWKVLLPEAYGERGAIPAAVLGPTQLAGPSEVCTHTYLMAGKFRSEDEAASLRSYLATRFVRFLISLRKSTQHTSRNSFLWVPMQSWDRVWTDEVLFEKYQITQDEQVYIKSVVKEVLPS